jgi:methionyl aminopeptidase
MVPGYKWATCINVNQGVVHGIPGKYRLQNGDLLSLDIGMFYKGLHTDMATTIQAGNLPKRQAAAIKIGKFLRAGERALEKAIQVAKVGNRVGHISAAIEKEIKKAGFNPIEALTGHGIGKKLHEEPKIPCFLEEKITQTAELKPGMTLAIDVIYAQGSPEVILKDDGWTLETVDRSLAALFEKTILIGSQIAKVLT